uniref:Uncharacterized protein MANES_10G081300 n=1 Tax=Rhizophora mucronata TaxID=61149 RepID=A0A2P2JRX0_RHIMU
MSENPLQPLFQTFQKVSDCVRTHFSILTGQSDHPSPSSQKFVFSFSSSLPKISPTNRDTALVQSQDILIKVCPLAMLSCPVSYMH